MAAVNSSFSGGFSYAQAARGQASTVTSQTPSSKVTSGTASPATGAVSEVTSGSNWADDVEDSIKDTAHDEQKTQPEDDKPLQPTETPAEHIKVEDKVQSPTSGASSPNLAASSSTATKEEDSSVPPTATSSETTSESRSQTSEPAWIAERKERQSNSQSAEKTPKAEKKKKDPEASPASKPVTLQDAAPPSINPWMKRAEDAAKSKAGATARPTVPSRASDTSALKENQRPQADSRRKANSVSSIPKQLTSNASEDVKTPNGPPADRKNDVRSNGVWSGPKQAIDNRRSDSAFAPSHKSTTAEHQRSVDASNTTPLVKDQQSWPTPDSAPEKYQKETPTSSDEKRIEDATPTTKRKKQEYYRMEVLHNVIWETPSMNERKGEKSRSTANGDRGGRGGGGQRARGGYRGTPNGTNGSDRQGSRASSSPTDQDAEPAVEQRGRSDREAMPPPSKPARASSAGPLQDRKSDYASDRAPKTQSSADASPTDKSNAVATPDLRKTSVTKPSTIGRRNKSPRKTDTDLSQSRDAEFVPKPIPRRSSVGTQTEEVAGSSETNMTDGPPVRIVPTEGRKDSRTFESTRDSGAPRGAGGKRGGRGRGGNGTRELPNGHPANHTYGGNYAQDFVPPSSYGTPPSPYAARGNHQFTYPIPARGAWSARGLPRAHSIPIDPYYAQRNGGQYAPGHPQVPAIQTYVPGMFDANGYPMTAVAFPSQMDPQYLIEMVGTQLEYYFSVDNLLKDMFLRRHMDSQGFVFLDVIANFNRVKQLTQDKDLIRTACINSRIIEIRLGEDGKERLRKADGWDQFLLPIEQREETAQTNGPVQLARPERPQLPVSSTPAHHRGPASAGVNGGQSQRFDRRSYDSAYPMSNSMTPQYGSFNGVPEVVFSEMTNGEEARGRSTKSPIHENGLLPTQQPMTASLEEPEFESDSFPDEQISALTVVVKTNQANQQRIPYHSLASRTFSNGSIDSRSIAAEIEKPTEASSQPKANGDTLSSGSELLPTLSRVASPSGRSRERTPINNDMNVFWMKDQEKPTDDLPTDLASESYGQLRLRAFESRTQAATGNCPYDLNVLYQFWCHFLIRNFNNRMYTEFKYYANADASERHSFNGLQNLLKFYAQALSSHNPIRDRVVKDYVQLVQNEPATLDGAAFKQLRSAWRNGALNLKNRKKLSDIMDDKLKEQLDRLET